MTAGKTLMLSLLFSGLLSAAPQVQHHPGQAGEPEFSDGEIEFVFDAPRLENVDLQGNSWTLVDLEGCGTLGRPGAPDLPSFSRLVEIPDFSDVRFELVDGDFEDLRTEPVLPEQARCHSETDLPLPFVYREDFYRDQVYPAQTVEWDEPALLRNHRVAKLTVYPVQMLDEGRGLRIWSRMLVRVTFQGENPVNQRTYSISNRETSLSRAVRNLIVNRVQEDEALRGIFDPHSMPGTYLVLARNTVITGNSAFFDFVEWKRRKGHKVYVRTQSDVGTWTNTNIFNYVQDAYETWEDTPDFLLLVGDSGSSDSDYELPAGPGGSYDGQQDHYYSRLEGGDILGDIAVGRISVEGAQQLGAVLHKIEIYETDPTGHGAGDDWLAHAALLVGWDTNSMYQQTLSIAIDLGEMGYDDIDSLYSTSSHTSWLNARYAEGISVHNYRGWVGMNDVYPSWIDNDDNLNNSYMTPMAMTPTCNSGDFNSSYCQSEAFLRKGDYSDPRGAVAGIGMCTSGTHTEHNNALCGGFWSGFCDWGLPQVGVCMFYGKYTLYISLPPGDSNAEIFANRENLMGDPGTELWLGRPEDLSVTHDPILSTGQTHAAVLVESDGQPLPGAVVCFYQATMGVQELAITGDDGIALVGGLEGAVSGDIELTVTKWRHLPYLTTLSVTDQSAYPSVVDAGIEGDGLATPGEAVSFRPTLENTGSSTTLTGVSGSLSLDPAYGTVLDGSSTWQNISVGATRQAQNPFEVQLETDLLSGAVVPAELLISSNQGSFTEYVELPVSAPRLMVEGTVFDPGGSIAPPGVSTEMSVTLGNIGNFDATGLTALLTGSDPFVSITDGSDTVGDIPVSGSGTAVFDLNIAGEAFPGYTGELRLTWTSGGVIQGQVPVIVSVGTATSHSPTGPDNYGYRAYEDVDENTESPVFSWIPLAPAEGGSGATLQPLSDNGEDQDDAVLITLDFDFVYYGETFDQLGICSNGFVSFGPTGYLETDFRDHPLPCGLGPDNMIAPMWDDHMITVGNSGVYTQYFPAEHIFVVEWYNVQLVGFNPERNTFQVVLYDPAHHPTATGDGEFLFQYLEYNNVQENEWTWSGDFPYCTVGFKNGNSTDGLTLTHWNIYDQTVDGIHAGKAIKCTTELGQYTSEDIAPPVIVHTPLSDSPDTVGPWTVSAQITDASGVAVADLQYQENGGGYTTLAMSNAGDQYWADIPGPAPVGTVFDYRIYTVDASPNANGTTSPVYSFEIVTGNPPTGPDGYGYYIYDSADAGEAKPYDWVDISGVGTDLNLSDDDTVVLGLPFNLVFYGASFSQLSVCSNGFVVLGSSTYTSYTNRQLAAGDGTSYMVCPFWDDMDPSSGGSVRYWEDLTNQRIVIAWIDVPHWGSYETETFQVILYHPGAQPTVTGDSPILAQYQLVDDAGSCTVGIQDGSTYDGIQYLYNGAYGADAGAIQSGQTLWITTGAAALDPVDDLTISVDGGIVDLSWSDTGAPAYSIYRDADPYGGFGDLAGTTSSTTWSEAASGSWFYVVRASSALILAGGESDTTGSCRILARHSTVK